MMGLVDCQLMGTTCPMLIRIMLLVMSVAALGEEIGAAFDPERFAGEYPAGESVTPVEAAGPVTPH